jgi:MerR family copper efflux transcriptional regulator
VHLDPVAGYGLYIVGDEGVRGTNTLTIGQVAKEAGVGVETVRFYEREGLLDEPPRSASGYRQYPADTVTRLRFIRRAKDLGFSLNEINDMITLSRDPRASVAEVKSCAEAKIADIEDRLRDLQRVRDALVQLTQSCDGRTPMSRCPILLALNQEEGALTSPD